MIRKHLKTRVSLPIATLAALLVFVTTADPAASAPGIPNTPGIHEVANTVTLSGTNTGPVLATCPAGEVALGGGWNVPPRARVFAAVLQGNTWAVSVANAGLSLSAEVATEPKPGAEIGIGAVTAYVECVHGVAGLVVTAQSSSISVPANQRLVHAGFCNTGEVLVGSAFDLGGPSANIWLETNSPTTAAFGYPLWFFSGMNQDSVAHSVSFSVQCLGNFSLGAYTLYLQNTGGPVSAITTGSVTALCPSWMQVAGGGLGISAPTGGIANPYLLHAANGGWQGGTFGVTGSVLTLFVPTAIAICLPFSAPPGSPQLPPPNAPPR